jgi:hypothetical protein
LNCHLEQSESLPCEEPNGTYATGAKAFNRKGREAKRKDRQENQNDTLKMISFASLKSVLGGLCG